MLIAVKRGIQISMIIIIINWNSSHLSPIAVLNLGLIEYFPFAGVHLRHVYVSKTVPVSLSNRGGYRPLSPQT